MCRET